MILIFNIFINFLILVHVSRVKGINPVILTNYFTSNFPYRIDTPRLIKPLFNPYTLTVDLKGHIVCSKFQDWNYTSSRWDTKLNPYHLTLCSKDYGGGGNCLFYVISGVLKENGYNIGHFDLERPDISPGLKVSIAGFNFNKQSYFSMRDVRILSGLAYVGINPYNKEALKHFDLEQFTQKVQMTVYGIDLASDIKWDPQILLDQLRNKTRDPLAIAREVYDNLCSASPVNSWGSGDDIYAISDLLNIDFLIFHKQGEIIQHIMSSHKKPVCTINLYYYDMSHFRSAGVVSTYLNSDARKLSNVYRGFEIDERLYDLIPRKFETK